MNAARMLIRVTRRHHACVERQIGDMGIHHSQHRTLLQLARRQEDIPSQKELAEIMGVSPAAVTTILKKMEREGYVSRSVTDEDNRRNEIRITEAGLAKITESRAVFESTDRAMLAGFSPEELEQLLIFMERMDRNLDALGAPADPPPPHSPTDRKPPYPTERK
jgi:DNA-binding MarR family transcriptional regulator